MQFVRIGALGQQCGKLHELLVLAGALPLGLQARIRMANDSAHPHPGERLFWRVAIARLGEFVELLRARDVALGSMLGIALVEKEASQCGQQERTEAAALRIGVSIPAALDEAQEEGLGQVFGVGLGIAATAHEGEHRRPVGAA